MPNYTQNLNLAKPVPETDVADITVLNENMDKLDVWSLGLNIGIDDLKMQLQEIREHLSNGTFGKSSLAADYSGDFYLGK